MFYSTLFKGIALSGIVGCQSGMMVREMEDSDSGLGNFSVYENQEKKFVRDDYELVKLLASLPENLDDEIKQKIGTLSKEKYNNPEISLVLEAFCRIKKKGVLPRIISLIKKTKQEDSLLMGLLKEVSAFSSIEEGGPAILFLLDFLESCDSMLQSYRLSDVIRSLSKFYGEKSDPEIWRFIRENKNLQKNDTLSSLLEKLIDYKHKMEIIDFINRYKGLQNEDLDHLFLVLDHFINKDLLGKVRKFIEINTIFQSFFFTFIYWFDSIIIRGNTEEQLLFLKSDLLKPWIQDSKAAVITISNLFLIYEKRKIFFETLTNIVFSSEILKNHKDLCDVIESMLRYIKSKSEKYSGSIKIKGTSKILTLDELRDLFIKDFPKSKSFSELRLNEVEGFDLLHFMINYEEDNIFLTLYLLTKEFMANYKGIKIIIEEVLSFYEEKKVSIGLLHEKNEFYERNKIISRLFYNRKERSIESSKLVLKSICRVVDFLDKLLFIKKLPRYHEKLCLPLFLEHLIHIDSEKLDLMEKFFNSFYPERYIDSLSMKIFARKGLEDIKCMTNDIFFIHPLAKHNLWHLDPSKPNDIYGIVMNFDYKSKISTLWTKDVNDDICAIVKMINSSNLFQALGSTNQLGRLEEVEKLILSNEFLNSYLPFHLFVLLDILFTKQKSIEAIIEEYKLKIVISCDENLLNNNLSLYEEIKKAVGSINFGDSNFSQVYKQCLMLYLSKYELYQKSIYMHFMLGINPDFDSDLLETVIEMFDF